MEHASTTRQFIEDVHTTETVESVANVRKLTDSPKFDWNSVFAEMLLSRIKDGLLVKRETDVELYIITKQMLDIYKEPDVPVHKRVSAINLLLAGSAPIVVSS